MSRSKELTTLQKQAIVLDGAGYSKQQIARVLDVSESTVGKWRRSDDYQEKVRAVEERHALEIEPLIERVRTELVEAASEAIKSLIKSAWATDANGDPIWDVRNQATIALLSYFKTAAVAEDAKQDGDGVTPRTAVIEVRLPGAAGNNLAKDARTIEGSAKEV